MAEQIVKTYLLETNMLEVHESDKDKFDFLCLFTNDVKKVFAVEVKSSQYTKSELLRKYQKQRESYHDIGFAVFMFYINYVDKTGYFEIIKGELKNELILLNTENLKYTLLNFNFA